MLDLDLLQKAYDEEYADDVDGHLCIALPIIQRLLAELRASRKVVEALEGALKRTRWRAGMPGFEGSDYSALTVAVRELQTINVGEKDWPHDTTPNGGR